MNDGWWSAYNRYLRSPGWFALRAAVLRRDGYRCCYCSRYATQVHHLSYRRWDDPALLVSVCKTCHELIHNRTIGYGVRQHVPGRPEPKGTGCVTWLWVVLGMLAILLFGHL